MAAGVIIASILISAALSAYAIMQGRKVKSADMRGDEGFKPTLATEGATVALIYGKVRVPGNIIWYGNLVSKKSKSQSSGGKNEMMGGGGGDTGSVDYYVDCWQAVGIGKLNYIEMYINDEKKEPEAERLDWNDGTMDDYPTEPGEDANRIKGVAHWFARRLYIGNSAQIPTIHFVIDRVLDTPLNYQNLDNGSNPAAVIYDLLKQAGVGSERINQDKFNEAASYFKDAGYGINLVFDSQMPTHEMIDQILSYVEAIMYTDIDNKYALKAIDPNATYTKEIDEYDISDFTLNRKSWMQMATDFRGTYVSEEDDFSERVVLASNFAAEKLAGNKNVVGIDLKCFRDKDTASKRVWAIMKRDSYPTATIKFKTNFKYGLIFPGDIIRVYHSSYGLDGVDFRVLSIDQMDFDKQELAIEAKQQVETLYDDNYTESGSTSWENEDVEPETFQYSDAYFMPPNRSNITQSILINRKKFMEKKAEIQKAPNVFSGSDEYTFLQDLLTFSCRCRLTAAYNYSGTIDDTVGIYLTPSTGILDPPEVSFASRNELFNTRRVLIFDPQRQDGLGNQTGVSVEICAFQNIELVSGGYRLTGILRGVLGTPKVASFPIDTICWIARLEEYDNTISVLYEQSFRLKYYAWIKNKKSIGASASLCYTKRINDTPAPARVVAVRTGSSVDIQIWPCSPYYGAGLNNESITDHEPPFDFDGRFVLRIEEDATHWEETTDNFTITRVGAFTLRIQSFNSSYSDYLYLSIGSSDGTYKVSKPMTMF